MSFLRVEIVGEEKEIDFGSDVLEVYVPSAESISVEVPIDSIIVSRSEPESVIACGSDLVALVKPL